MAFRLICTTVQTPLPMGGFRVSTVRPCGGPIIADVGGLNVERGAPDLSVLCVSWLQFTQLATHRASREGQPMVTYIGEI